MTARAFTYKKHASVYAEIIQQSLHLSHITKLAYN